MEGFNFTIDDVIDLDQKNHVLRACNRHRTVLEYHKDNNEDKKFSIMGQNDVAPTYMGKKAAINYCRKRKWQIIRHPYKAWN